MIPGGGYSIVCNRSKGKEHLYIPPFLVRDKSILVVVYILEEVVEPAHWDGNAGALKCHMKLVLVQLSILISVY